MIERIGKDRLLEMLLLGTPDRMLDAVAATSPDDRADLAAAREMLALEALAAPRAAPPPALRERLLATRPRPRRPRRPAVIVLDMIQDHLTPGRPLEVPRAREIVPALKKRLDEARAASIPILFVCDTHPLDDVDFNDWPVHALEGTPGADPWPELGPEPGDRVIRKRTYSAFTGSELGQVLDELATDRIILTGCATELGLSVTATDALQRGFVVDIPPDSQAGTSMLVEQITMLTLSAMPPYDPRYLRRVE